MDKDKKPLNSEPWWKPGITLLSEVSTWIIVPIVLALIVGKSLDTHYNTKPTLFLICVAVAFLFTCIGMIRVVKRYIKTLKDLEEENKK
jgi:Kef-type K+ transport system membrane component KefB